MRTFNIIPVKGRAVVAAVSVVLIGCTGGPVANGQLLPDPIPKSVVVTAADVPVVIAAPAGFCVDRATIDENPRGVFMFLSNCQRVDGTGQMARTPISDLLTASVSPTGLAGSDKGMKQALDALGEFLSSPVGVFSMGKSNIDGAVKILKVKQSDVALYILLEDSAITDAAGASNRYWRAFTEVNGRLVAVSVTGYSKKDPEEKRALRIIRAFVQAIRDANTASSAT